MSSSFIPNRMYMITQSLMFIFGTFTGYLIKSAIILYKKSKLKGDDNGVSWSKN